MYWLHGGKAFESISSPDAVLLAKHYAMGEQVQDRRYQNLVINRIIAATCPQSTAPSQSSAAKCPSFEAVSVIYKSTPKGSPGRRLMVDVYAIKGDSTWMEDFPVAGDGVEIAAEILADISQALFNRRELTKSARQLKLDLEAKVASSHYHIEEEDAVKTKDVDAMAAI
jgi:hypothetical protein